MSLDLQSRIRSLRSAERRITPDAAWVRRTRETLLMQVKNTLPAEQMPVLRRVREFIDLVVVSKMVQAMRKPLMATLSIIAVALGGSILSVSAAEHSLPGDFFYGLKLVTEQARLALTPAAEDKLKLKTEFTERRVTELQQVVKQPEQVAQVTELLKRDLSTMKQQLADVNQDAAPATAVAAAKLVDQKTNQVISALQETKAQLSPDAKEKVTEVQSAAADTGVKAIEVLAEQHQESSDNVPAADIAQAIKTHTQLVVNVTPTVVGGLNVTSSSATTTPLVTPAAILATTSTQITSSTLPAIVNQVKDITVQAFALQKAQDQLAVAASALSEATTDASSTAPIVTTSSTQITASSTSPNAATSSAPTAHTSTSSTPPTASTGTAP